MKKIEKITPAVCKDLRPMIDAALAALGNEHGLTIKAGNGSYEQIAE